MFSRRRLLVTICCLFFHLGSLICFLYGFFPLATKLTAIHETNLFDKLNLSNCDRLKNEIKSGHFRTVLLVIDALRADFLLDSHGSRMRFLREMIDEGEHAESYTAIVQSPTVTMPRIKAITAGIVPAFVDFALNLASAEFLEDNFLARMKSNDKIMTFFGDDTWLRLFPNHFKRSDGTTSFLVTDFYEVDNNVTRHLDEELIRNDWQLMIMHYLGLDHIGHVCGPFCDHLITPKLQEMDRVVEKIYTTLEQTDKNFIIIVLGDHGMSDSGGHGGSSLSEIKVPLVFVSPSLKRRSKIEIVSNVQQVDLAPTLASLLDVPIPRRNLGVLLDVSENFVDDSFTFLSLWKKNAAQLMNLYADHARVEEFSAEFKMILNLHNNFCESNSAPNSTRVDAIVDHYKIFSNKIRMELMNSYTNYNVPYMIGALIVCWCSFFALFGNYFAYNVFENDGMKTIFVQFSYKSPFFFALLTHSGSFLSSSFIEEEHQTWYFLWLSLTFILFWHCAKKRNLHKRTIPWFLLAFMLHRIAREWNRTGDKWRHLEDLGDYLAKVENFYILNILSLLCASIGSYLIVKRLKTNLSMITFYIGMALVIAYRYQNDWLHTQAVWQARCVYIASFGLLFQSKNNFISALGSFYLIMLILVKPWNVPLLTIILALGHVLIRLCSFVELKFEEKITFYYFTMACSYFYLGNSNNIGHIDVASGYVGLSSYNPPLVCLLMMIHFYCGPILMCLSLINDNKEAIDVRFPVLLCLMKNICTSFYLLLAFVQRYHLFIWSVFAPKLLYECFHSAFVSVITFLICMYKLVL